MLSCNQSRFTSGLLHAVFVGFDHLLDHLPADRAGLAAGKVAVIAVLQIDADFGGGLHLELVHRLARIGVHELVTGSVRHSLHLLFIRLVRIRKAGSPAVCFSHPYRAYLLRSDERYANSRYEKNGIRGVAQYKKKKKITALKAVQ